MPCSFPLMPQRMLENGRPQQWRQQRRCSQTLPTEEIDRSKRFQTGKHTDKRARAKVKLRTLKIESASDCGGGQSEGGDGDSWKRERAIEGVQRKETWAMSREKGNFIL